MHITKIIKTIMKSKKLTQKDMTERLHVSAQSAISQYLSGEMRFSTAVKFTQDLNCTLRVVDNETGEVFEVTAE